MANSQHRCVFVGNIPYDATEEQLIEICQEVGPVVSFRLVIDRETGKPKGYGFCEYKDEETALSARRNLQGYEINGRQLRVDFAENDKASGREQSRSGPGPPPSADPLKQAGVPTVLGNPTQQHHQPVGLQTAITAADVIVGSLGGARPGIQGQLALANDPLTLHLSKLSRNQLNEVLSDMKVMATQNKELARQLLLGRPQLSKALFQAQIMLGMVAPQVLQMPNLVQTSGQASHLPFQGNQMAQVSVPQLPSLPLAQSSIQPALLPKLQEGQISTVPQNTLARGQIFDLSQLPAQPRGPPTQNANDHHAIQKPALRANSLVSAFPPIQTHSTSSLSIRPQLQVVSSSFNQQIPPSLLNNPQSRGAANLVQNPQMVHSNATTQPSLLPRHSASDTRYQPGPSISSGSLQPTGRDGDTSAQVPAEATWANRNISTNSNLPPYSAEKKRVVSDHMESVARPSKIMKHDGGTLPVSGLNRHNGSLQPQVSGVASLTVNGAPTSEAQKPERQMSQAQLPSGLEDSVLLQQVMSLTPEQLSSLPPEQQQQVIQLQQMLRREQIQPS